MIPRLKRQAKRRQKREQVKHRWFGDQTIDLDINGVVIPMPVRNMVVRFSRRLGIRYTMERDTRFPPPDIMGAVISAPHHNED